MVDRTSTLAACFLILVIGPHALLAAGGDPKLIDVAKPATRPAGAPGYADVCFSSRWVHPRGKDDPHDSLEAMKAFHATRLEWAYITDKKFLAEIKKRGMTYCPAINTSAFVGDLREKQRRGRILDLNGGIITAPWMRMWKNSSWGCVNCPDYRQSYLTRLKHFADLGADSIQTDDPGNNWTAVNWGGCFCTHCMTGFTAFLQDEIDAEERKALGIEDLDRFNYGEHLRSRNAPVGDDYGKWDGGRLKKLFAEFQRRSVERFYEDMWSALFKHAGRRFPISSNNYGGRWSFPYHLFDMGMAELPHRDAHPARIREKLIEARQRGKAQIFTFVSTDVRETRRVIAACYANGGHLIVPWDVYLKSTPEGSERYFGKPEEYADLYGFVREHAVLFDGYEDAAAIGPDMHDDRYPEPPLAIAGAANVAAFARVRPGEADAPVVIHLINTVDRPQSFRLSWRRSTVFGDRPSRAALLLPGHPSRSLDVTTREARSEIAIEQFPLWGLVVLRPDVTP